LGAVAKAVAGDERLVIICAGQDDRFSLDDALCAGHLIRRLVKGVDEEPALNDSSRAVRALASARNPTREFLSLASGGAAIIEIGLGDDLLICCDVDRHEIVALMTDQAITRVEA
jgi:2-phosphosulfolactate phosphatase